MANTPRLKLVAFLKNNTYKKKIYLIPILSLVVIVFLVILIGVYGGNKGKIKYISTIMEFRIDSTWDNKPINDDDIIISLKSVPNGESVLIEVSAPFYRNPGPPPGPPGPFFKLWDYEVVEAFFLGKDERYLEVELGPYGHHLLLLLNGHQNCVKHSIPLKYDSRIDDDFWWGQAVIPADYFPPNVTLFNAYGIHGTGDDRVYKALYPAPEGKYDKPDFHRLNLFRDIEFDRILPANRNARLSTLWKDAIDSPKC